MAIQRYMVAWTGWVPPVTVRSPSRRGARQAAQTVWGVLEDDGLGAGVAVAVAPLLEGQQDRLKFLAGLGEQVLVARWVLAVQAALDDAGLFELAQPCGEHVAGGPGAGGDVLEAGLSVAQLAGYEQGVAVPDD
jgi:hypothetical protein